MAEPLSPSAPVRIAGFWLLPTIVSYGLKAWPAFQAKSVGKQALGYILGFCASVWTSAYFAASWQMKALPTSKELAEIGGQQFQRPSDGGTLEYFVSGTVGSTTVVVFCHRMDGKAGADYGGSKVAEVLKLKGACLLSPSVPSLSASTPYSSHSPVQWLKQWSRDMMALLDVLGAKDVYVLGLSWGAQPCVNLAMACQERGLLRGVGTIGGAMWDTKLRTWDIPLQHGTTATLFTNLIIVKPIAYLMIRPMVSSMGDTERLMLQATGPEEAKVEVEYIRKYFGDLKSFGEGTVRSMSYFLHQNWQVTLTALIKESDAYVDWSKFNPTIPFHLNIGDKDTLTPAAQPEYTEFVKHAKIVPFEGTHSGFPLDTIIANLFQENA